MLFEVRGKIFGMEMPNNWRYYPEGLLVLPEESLVSFGGEVYDENQTPIDVIVQKNDIWGGYVVLFRNYALEKSKIYEKFGVFTTEEVAIYIARMILLCNRAFQYNWRGINQVILYGEKFDLDIAMAIAFLHLLLPKTAACEMLINPEPNGRTATNPIVLMEHQELDWKKTDSIEAKGISRKTRSYTRLLMMHYHHHIPGIGFFNEEAFMDEVMKFIESGADGTYPDRWSWSDIGINRLIPEMEEELKRVYKKYSDGIVPTEYLETVVDRNTIIAPGYAKPITSSDDNDKKDNAADEA